MTYLGMTMDAARRSFGWGHLADWVLHLPAESATARWWWSGGKERMERASGVRELPTNGTSRFGSGAIPISEFDSWYYGS
jgi:hypothetical protein